MTLLAVYFVFILDYGKMMLDKKQIGVFLFEFKMGHKAADNSQHQQCIWLRTATHSAVVVQDVLQRRREP